MNIVFLMIFLCTSLSASQQLQSNTYGSKENSVDQGINQKYKNIIERLINAFPDEHRQPLRLANNPFMYVSQHNLMRFIHKHSMYDTDFRIMHVAAIEICTMALREKCMSLGTAEEVILWADCLYMTYSPLQDSLAHYACKNNVLAVLITVLKAGVNKNYCNIHGDTIAHYATQFSHGLIYLKILSKFGVRFDIKNNKGEFPAYCSAFDFSPLALEKTQYALLVLHRDVPIVQKDAVQNSKKRNTKKVQKQKIALLQKRKCGESLSLDIPHD